MSSKNSPEYSLEHSSEYIVQHRKKLKLTKKRWQDRICKMNITKQSHTNIEIPLVHFKAIYVISHGLRTPDGEIAFTARPKINSHSQIFRYGRSIFCLPYRPKSSDFFDLCLHWVSVVCAITYTLLTKETDTHDFSSDQNSKSKWI